jgi:putative transposase
MQALLNRSLKGSAYPYVFLDSSYLGAAGQGSAGLLPRYCRRHGGKRGRPPEVAGPQGGRQRERALLGGVTSHLKGRGLTGVKLVISDAHAGLTKSIGLQQQGSVWQRCRVHFACNLLQSDP